MGYLPDLKEFKTSREVVSVFGGYNHNLRIAENEFDGMENMSSSYYPVLSPRGNRGILTQLTDPNGLTAKSNLFWVDGTTLYYNGVAVSGLVLADSAKQFVSMGAYLLIWPDKKYFNTADNTYGNLGASITISGDVTCTLTKSDGTEYATPDVSDTAPTDPEDGDLWLDTSGDIHVLKQYSVVNYGWVSVATTYIKIAATSIGALFSAYDGVTISGFSNTALNGNYILEAVSTDYIVVTGILDATVVQAGGVTVARVVPDMDYLTESENRVWGCSSTNHEVYACKLGDPKNWNCFMGISTDSFAQTIGSDGKFTGACTLHGTVLFFKEEILHKVIGNMPSNYQISDTKCRGVESGSEKSMVIVNEVLYYKARTAICRYDGSFPEEISIALGNVRYTDGVAGALGNKYYISMKDPDGDYQIFVYDTGKGLWHREDDMQASYFAAHEGELFFIDATTKKIITVNGRLSVHEGGTKYDATHGAAEADFNWYAESGDIGLFLPDNKYVSRLMLRGVAENNFTVSCKYDGSATWIDSTVTVNTTLKTYIVNIIPRRCDHMRIKIAGSGDFKLYSITKTIEEAG